MDDEGLGVTDIGEIFGQLKTIDEAEGPVAIREAEGQDPPEFIVVKPFGRGKAGILLQPRIFYPGYLVMPVEKTGNWSLDICVCT
jgi:hypothetical protein